MLPPCKREGAGSNPALGSILIGNNMAGMSTISWEKSSCGNWIIDLNALKNTYYYKHIIHFHCEKRYIQQLTLTYTNDTKYFSMTKLNKCCLFCYEEVPKDFLLYLKFKGF